MLALEYLLGVILFCGVFLLGDLMTEQSHRLSDSPARRPFPPERVRTILLYAGRIFQLVAVVWGFVDAVSVLVLVF